MRKYSDILSWWAANLGDGQFGIQNLVWQVEKTEMQNINQWFGSEINKIISMRRTLYLS